MKTRIALLALLGAAAAGSALAAEGAVPAGIPRLNHVFVIMMENHGIGQVLNNPNLPYINELTGVANTANRASTIPT